MRMRSYLSPTACWAVMTTMLLLIVMPVTQTQGEEVSKALKEMLDEASQQVEPVAVEELADMMDQEHEMTLVDVRTEAEYEARRLRGAVWIPRGKLEFVAAKGELGSTSDEIVVYCKRTGAIRLPPPHSGGSVLNK